MQISDDEVVINQDSEITETSDDDDIVYLDSIEAVAEVVRENMKARVTSFTVYYKSTSSDRIMTEAVSLAMEHTGVPTEGDYLRYQFNRWQTVGTSYVYDDETEMYYFTYPMVITYYTSAEQEAEVDTAVANPISSLNIPACATDYYKVKLIYDWICSNVRYDYVHYTDSDYKIKYTAYAALINNRSVCQGYANLLYRLLLEVGVDARIVAGTDNRGDSHSWNIVELDVMWYYLDVTWEVTCKNSDSDYVYFLKSGFSDHVLRDEYEASDFSSSHTISSFDYDMEGVVTLSHTESDAVAENMVDATCATDGSPVVIHTLRRLQSGKIPTHKIY